MLLAGFRVLRGGLVDLGDGAHLMIGSFVLVLAVARHGSLARHGQTGRYLDCPSEVELPLVRRSGGLGLLPIFVLVILGEVSVDGRVRGRRRDHLLRCGERILVLAVRAMLQAVLPCRLDLTFEHGAHETVLLGIGGLHAQDRLTGLRVYKRVDEINTSKLTSTQVLNLRGEGLSPGVASSILNIVLKFEFTSLLTANVV